jgi:hypothetical protein
MTRYQGRRWSGPFWQLLDSWQTTKLRNCEGNKRRPRRKTTKKAAQTKARPWIAERRPEIEDK